jgi:hypothetical protein
MITIWHSLMALLLLAVSAGLPAAAAFDLQGQFSQIQAWDEGADPFIRRHWNDGFRPASIRQEGATALDGAPVIFLGLAVYDAEVRYDAKTGKPWRVNISLYNRGDADTPLSADGFDELEKKVQKMIGQTVGMKPALREGDLPEFGVDRNFYLWRTGKISYLLEVSVTKREGKVPRPEYIKVVMTPERHTDYVLSEYTKAPLRLNRDQLQSKVLKGKDRFGKGRAGDIWLSIPMVNQGRKGYCGCAVTARFLQYYERNMTMHDVAQITDSDNAKGTEVGAWFRRLNEIGPKLQISILDVPEFNVVTPEGIRNYILSYNQQTRQPLRPEDLQRFTSFTDVLDAMDKSTLRRARTTKEQRFIFQRFLKQTIDGGVPIAWGVTLGLVKEEMLTPQAKGGHMRMIIGYNPQENLIIYSDTWGYGHEKKYMMVDDALYITNNMFAIFPFNNNGKAVPAASPVRSHQ